MTEQGPETPLGKLDARSECQIRLSNKKEPGGLPMLIEELTLHQLQHIFCTLMYFAGVDVS